MITIRIADFPRLALVAVVLLGALGAGLAHADPSWDGDRARRDDRTDERRDDRRNDRRETVREPRQEYQDPRRDGRSPERQELREDRANDRRDTVQVQRAPRPESRDVRREERAPERQELREERTNDRRDTVQPRRETRQERPDARRDVRVPARPEVREDRRDDRREGRRDDWRAGHVERRHYPSRGTVIVTLPAEHRVVTYRGSRYMFWDGVWYRPSGSRFIVIAPPIGIVVPILPVGYLSLWIGPSRYYYANSVYYAPDPRGYIVVERPAGAPDDPEDELLDTEPRLFIYPRRGQSEAQQADDRYECHRWAREQTGFDPSRLSVDGDSPPREVARSDYDRAMGACLDARGYTVR